MSKHLGPFLCHPTTSSMGFWFFSTEKLDKVIVRIGDEEHELKKIEDSDNDYNVYLGQIEGLKDNSLYYYSIALNNKKYLPMGLIDSDLYFRTLPNSPDERIEFIHMSCHGLEDFEKKQKDSDPWAMWKKINKELNKNKNCYYAILGGDQVYLDTKFENQVKEKNSKDYNNKIIEVYIRYWENTEYHKVFCRLPAFLMWDDHDIIDGFGSSDEMFTGKEFKEEWNVYKQATSKAFFYMQAVRNPENFLTTNNFTYAFFHQSIAILGLDARSERNVKKRQMLSRDSWEEINQKKHKLLEAEIIFINSPVTLARMGGSREKILGRISGYVAKLNTKNQLRTSFIWQIFSILLFFLYQLQIKNTSFLTSNLIVIATMTFLLIRSYTGSSLIGKSLRPTARALSYVILIIAAVFTHIELSKIAYTIDFEQIANEIIKDFTTFWFLFASCVISYAFFDKDSKNIIKSYAPVIHTLIFYSVMTWAGIPGGELDYHLAVAILSPVITSIVSIIGILVAYGIINELATLDDDIKDGWSSEENKLELENISNLLRYFLDNNKRVIVLSGDIHTGGITEFKFSDRDQTFYQVTSSPITYPPMPPIIEKITSSTDPVRLTSTEPYLLANNLFFISQRNFVIISNKESATSARFTFESLINEIKIDIR